MVVPDGALDPMQGSCVVAQTDVYLGRSPCAGPDSATVDGITASVALTVESDDPGQPGQVASVQLAPSRLRVWLGQGLGVAVTVYDSSRQEVEGMTVSWATEDTTVARVGSTGFVTGAGHGRTRVVATVEGVSGYAVVDSYARPEGAAELEFYALHSEATDPSTLEPAIDTTWVDSAGVVHDAWIRARPGALSMQWDATGGQYSQRLVLSTYIYQDGEIRTVAQNERGRAARKGRPLRSALIRLSEFPPQSAVERPALQRGPHVRGPAAFR